LRSCSSEMLGEQTDRFSCSEGRPGLIANPVPTVVKPLFRTHEESGLRCVYHGWKFDVDGATAWTCRTNPPSPTSRAESRPSAYPGQRVRRDDLGLHGKPRVPPPLPGIEAAAYDEGEYGPGDPSR